MLQETGSKAGTVCTPNRTFPITIIFQFHLIVDGEPDFLQTLDLQRSFLFQGLCNKNSKFMPILKV